MRKGDRTRAGFTLLEMSISMGMLAVLLYAVGMVTLAGNRAFRAGQSRDAIGLRARRCLDRIADEIGMAGLGSLTPNPVAPFGTSSLDLATPSGLVGGVVQWGSTTRIQLQYATDDPNDGVDNDGDGSIDDGRVVLVKNVGLGTQRTVVLCHGIAEYLAGEVPNGKDDNGNTLVDERGLSFVLNGETLTIRITLEGLDPERQRMTRTVETTVKLRN